MSKIKDWFKKVSGNDNQDPITAFENKVDIEHKKRMKAQAAKEERQNKVVECILVMKDCREMEKE